MAEQRRSDRRVVYTKRVLREALVKLLRTNHISEITITSICELADINRSTFYLHYRDQYDLLHQIEDEVLREVRNRMVVVQEELDENAAWRPVTHEMMLAVLEYTKENHELSLVLFGGNCDFSFREDVLKVLKEIIPFPKVPLSKSMIDMIMTHAINGGIDLLVRWINDGAVEDPRVIADLILKLAYSGTTSFNPGG